MATGQFDIVLGGHDADVTAFNGGSIGSSGVRVIVDDTNCRKKEDAIQGINYILNRIKEGTWPPTIFSPLSLFAAGEQGAWYDPSDLTTLFQDDAGTVPVTATGQTVGRILDKSGRGNHATQATAGSRPTFRDVGGLRYLEFDGVDDFLVTGNINFTATDELSTFVVMQKTSATPASTVLLEFSTSSSITNGTFAYLAADATSMSVRSRGTAASTLVISGVSAGASHVLTMQADISADSVIGRRDGASAGTSATDQGTGNYGTQPLYIGMRGGVSLPYIGNVYGIAIRGSLTDASTITSMEAYMANKAGITLV